MYLSTGFLYTRINNQCTWLPGTNRKTSTKGGWRWQLLFSMPINAALSVTRSALCNLECFGQIRKSQQRKQKMLMPAVNELTFSGHIRKLITPCAWATHVEVMAAATYFQVPVYECCLDPSKTKYRWECIAPQSPPSHFRYPEVTEDMFTREVVVPNHFELVYIHNQHYDCIVSHETGKLSATLPTLMESHIFVTEIL